MRYLLMAVFILGASFILARMSYDLFSFFCILFIGAYAVLSSKRLF